MHDVRRARVDDDAFQRVAVECVADDGLGACASERGCAVFLSRESDDLMTFADELMHERQSHRAGCARNENSHGFLHSSARTRWRSAM
jgi:hypothetical protein